MRTEKYGLKVDDKLVEFVEANALPGIDISSDNFWKGLASIVDKLGPKNLELLQKRKELKQKIDGWHIESRGKQFDAANYKEFLKSIGYLVDEGADFEIETVAFSGLEYSRIVRSSLIGLLMSCAGRRRGCCSVMGFC